MHKKKAKKMNFRTVHVQEQLLPWLHVPHLCILVAQFAGEMRGALVHEFETRMSIAHMRLSDHTLVITGLNTGFDRMAAAGAVQTLDLFTGVQAHVLHTHAGAKFAVLENGFLALDEQWGSVSILDLETRKHRTMHTKFFQNTALAALPNNLLAVGGSNSHAVSIWDTVTCKCLFKLVPCASDAHCLHLESMPDNQLVSRHVDGYVRVWSLAFKRCVAVMMIPGVVLALAAVGRNAFACGFVNGHTQVWSVSMRKCVWTFVNHNAITAIAASQHELATGDTDGSINVWDLATGCRTARWKAHQDAVASLVVLPEGVLASASRDESVKLWV